MITNLLLLNSVLHVNLKNCPLTIRNWHAEQNIWWMGTSDVYSTGYALQSISWCGILFLLAFNGWFGDGQAVLAHIVKALALRAAYAVFAALPPVGGRSYLTLCLALFAEYKIQLIVKSYLHGVNWMPADVSLFYSNDIELDYWASSKEALAWAQCIGKQSQKTKWNGKLDLLK